MYVAMYAYIFLRGNLPKHAVMPIATFTTQVIDIHKYCNRITYFNTILQLYAHHPIDMY